MATSAVARSSRSSVALALTALRVLGLVFFLVALADILTSWLPPLFGRPEWELAMSAGFLDRFPLLALGLAILIADGVGQGKKVRVRTLAVVAVLMAVAGWLAFTLFATTWPMSFRAVTGNPEMMTTMKKAGAKALAQAAVYPFGLLWMAGAAWKATMTRRGRG